METHTRSIMKAVTWRTGGTIVTFSVAWLLIGDISQALGIGVVDTLVKVGAFYFHERLWNRLSFGKLKAPDYQI